MGGVRVGVCPPQDVPPAGTGQGSQGADKALAENKPIRRMLVVTHCRRNHKVAHLSFSVCLERSGFPACLLTPPALPPVASQSEFSILHQNGFSPAGAQALWQTVRVRNVSPKPAEISAEPSLGSQGWCLWSQQEPARTCGPEPLKRRVGTPGPPRWVKRSLHKGQCKSHPSPTR